MRYLKRFLYFSIVNFFARSRKGGGGSVDVEDLISMKIIIYISPGVGLGPKSPPPPLYPRSLVPTEVPRVVEWSEL